MRAAAGAVAMVTLMISMACSGDGGSLVRVEGAGYFNPPEIDFGVQPIAQAARRTVRFTNASGEDVQIIDVVYDPPSNAFGLKLEGGGVFRNTVLARSESAQLEVTFGPDREGPVDVVLLVRTQTLEIPLKLKGAGRLVTPATLEANPNTIIFSDVIVGSNAIQSLTVTNVGELPGAIGFAPSMTPFMVFGAGQTPVPSADIAPGESAQLEIHFRPVSAGSFDRTLYVETDDGVRTNISVRGDAVMPGTLTCDRTVVDLGDVVRSEVARASIRCTAVGAYIVASVTSDNQELVVENVSPAAGTMIDEFTFDIVFNSRGIAHDVSGEITVTASHGTRTTIAVTARTVPPPIGEADVQASIAWTTAVDMDIHFVRRGGLPFMMANDCHFESPTIDWNIANDERDDPFLDRDFESGPATEIITMSNGGNGIYEVYGFLNQHPGNAPPTTAVTATVRLRNQPDFVGTHTFTTCGSLWHVGTIHHDVSPPRFDVVDTASDAYRTLASCN